MIPRPNVAFSLAPARGRTQDVALASIASISFSANRIIRHPLGQPSRVLNFGIDLLA